MTVAFIGTRLDWIATKGTTLGIADFSVDGGAPVSVNLASSVVQYQQNVFTTGVLPAGLHTVKMTRNATNAAGKYISIDAVDVIGTLVPFSRIEQTDVRLNFTGTWSTFTTSSASAGSYKRTSATNGSVTVAFNGRRLDWIATKGTTMGVASVSVDGGPATQVVLNNASTQYQQAVWSTGTLADSLHVVTISWDPASDAGKYVSLDAFDVFGMLTAFSRIEQTDSRMLYTGTWANFTTATASGGSYRRANVSGASVDIPFIGQRLDIISTKGTTLGKMDVALDGVFVTTVDLANATTLYQQNVYSTGVIPSGYHVVTLSRNATNAAGKYISLDAVDVIGTLMSSVRVQQTDARLLYSGTWATFTTGSASGGSYIRSNTSGSSVTINFTGPRLDWIATKGHHLGIGVGVSRWRRRGDREPGRRDDRLSAECVEHGDPGARRPYGGHNLVPGEPDWKIHRPRRGGRVGDSAVAGAAEAATRSMTGGPGAAERPGASLGLAVGCRGGGCGLTACGWPAILPWSAPQEPAARNRANRRPSRPEGSSGGRVHLRRPGRLRRCRRSGARP